MSYKPTGRPVGRPLKDEPRLLTYSFKCEEALMDAAKEYAWQQRTSVGELIREGLRWRLEEGDPLTARSVAPPQQERNGNTTIPESMPVPLDADDLEALPLEPALDYDPHKHRLGLPCKKYGHQSHGAAGNLRDLVKGDCLACRATQRAENAMRQGGHP